MATQRWTGAGANVAQVGTITITGYDATTTYRVTMNSKVVGVLGTGGTTTTAAAALQAALAASEDPEFQEVTWTQSGAVITATANTPGTPFTATSSVSGGAGTIGAYTATTANSSKNDANNTANWSGGALPGTGDTAIFDDGTVDCLWNLGSAFSAADLTAVIVRDTYRGRIGLPVYSDNGIYEPSYRAGVFTAQTITSLTIEQSNVAGPGWYKFNTGSTACTLLIKGPVSTGLTPGDEVVWHQGSHASNTLAMEGGSYLGAPLAGQTARQNTIAAVNAHITLTSGFTFSTSGTLHNTTMLSNANIPALTMDGQNTVVRGENAITATTITLKEGVLQWNSSGTITTLGPVGGIADFSGDRRAKTVTNAVTVYRNGGVNDPNGIVTFSAGIVLTSARISELAVLDVGIGRTLTIS